ncbi:hypothetical protein [Bacillus arachidis]|uniref:Uncharacterized protein n=1 Tax=Bacillus arachidis TaxID=2819290 RepID=A0ABS3P5X6_9BACI|nr:hypothetical protein [Bacillus arachidis]MBO1628604.1 hypothetical protein [Bacillus arachidis]
MEFKLGETLIFEKILVRVVKITKENITFEVLHGGCEEDTEAIMEVPLWYITMNQDQIEKNNY